MLLIWKILNLEYCVHSCKIHKCETSDVTDVIHVKITIFGFDEGKKIIKKCKVFEGRG